VVKSMSSKCVIVHKAGSVKACVRLKSACFEKCFKNHAVWEIT
jgi:hypothetical protein